MTAFCIGARVVRAAAPASRIPWAKALSSRRRLVALSVAMMLLAAAAHARQAAATLPPGNSAQQWNAIAQETVVNTPRDVPKRGAVVHVLRPGGRL
jgi:uncharacterized lipoprotein YajG